MSSGQLQEPVESSRTTEQGGRHGDAAAELGGVRKAAEGSCVLLDDATGSFVNKLHSL